MLNSYFVHLRRHIIEDVMVEISKESCPDIDKAEATATSIVNDPNTTATPSSITAKPLHYGSFQCTSVEY
jgi:hypothetical protein